MIATNVDLTDIDYLMKLWQQGQSMRKGSVDNVSIQYSSALREIIQKLYLCFPLTRSLKQWHVTVKRMWVLCLWGPIGWHLKLNHCISENGLNLVFFLLPLVRSTPKESILPIRSLVCGIDSHVTGINTKEVDPLITFWHSGHMITLSACCMVWHAYMHTEVINRQ